MYLNPIAGAQKPAFVKGFDTFEEISTVLVLEDQFHDGEIRQIKLDDSDEVEIGLSYEGTYFTIICRGVLAKSMHFDLDNRWIYEVKIEKKDGHYEVRIDEESIKIEAEKIVIEEVIRPERANYTEEELQAIDMKAENPDIYVRCPRCGKELHYRAVGNSYEVRCYTEGCIKATSRGI